MTASNFGLRLALLETRVDQIETSLKQRKLLDVTPPPVVGFSSPQAVMREDSAANADRVRIEEGPSPQLSPGIPGEGVDISPSEVPHVAAARIAATDPTPAIRQSPVPIQPLFTQPKAAPPPLPVSLSQKAELLNYPSASEPEPVPQTDIEKTIGIKWVGWIGALVFVIGAALGVKYAYDQGWFTNLIPNWLWLTLIASAGFALIGAGEWVFRKINRLSAAGLYAAGVAVLFVASYSGHAYYELYSQSFAFICMGISALVGAAVAIRGDMVSIGVISLIGANLAPMLLGDRNAPLGSFFAYLLATQIVALVLASRGNGGKWWTLRGLSLGSIVFWVTSVMPGHRHETVTLVYTLIFAALYQLELIVTNLRTDLAKPARRGEAAGLAFSMFVTAALTFGVIQMNANHSSMVQTAWVLGIAAVCGIFGLSLPSLNRPALTDLATGYALQAIALLFVAVPIYANGMNIEIGWLILALGLSLIGVLGNKDLSRSTSMIAWALALIHLVIRNGNESVHSVFVRLDNIPIHTNAIMAMSLAIVGQFIAALAHFRQKDERITNAIRCVSVIATLAWCVTCLVELPMSTATFVILAYAWGLIAISKLLPEKLAATQGGLLLIAGAVKWLLLDAIGPAFVTRPAPLPVLLNSMTLSACILIVSAVVFVRMSAKLSTDRHIARTITVALKLAIAVIALVDLSVEISNWFNVSGAAAGLSDPRLAKQVALSIFWACFAVGLVAMGFAFREAPLRYMGLILLAATLLKVVTVDLSGVSQGYRTLSFIGVGLLMLGTSVLYGKVSPKLLGEDRSPGVPT
jgi:uncharacterized membrane protein